MSELSQTKTSQKLILVTAAPTKLLLPCVVFRTPKDMLEKIAELDYSQSQLRDVNAEMRHWLDVADDEVAVLRTENAHLRKQVKA